MEPPKAVEPPNASAEPTPHASADAEAQADAELVVGLRAGDARALAAAYGRYRARIFTFLMRLCGQRAQADDLFQETFVQLARHARTLRPDTNLRAWLFTVARNRALSHRRTSLWRMLRLSLFKDEVPTPTGAPLPNEQAAFSDTAKGLERALAKLSPPLREVLLLVGVEGLEQAQAAAVLNITEAALRQRLTRARAQLRTLMTDA